MRRNGAHSVESIVNELLAASIWVPKSIVVTGYVWRAGQDQTSRSPARPAQGRTNETLFARL